jgi:hypothetical protein
VTDYLSRGNNTYFENINLPPIPTGGVPIYSEFRPPNAREPVRHQESRHFSLSSFLQSAYSMGTQAQLTPTPPNVARELLCSVNEVFGSPANHPSPPNAAPRPTPVTPFPGQCSWWASFKKTKLDHETSEGAQPPLIGVKSAASLGNVFIKLRSIRHFRVLKRQSKTKDTIVEDELERSLLKSLASAYPPLSTVPLKVDFS